MEESLLYSVMKAFFACVIGVFFLGRGPTDTARGFPGISPVYSGRKEHPVLHPWQKSGITKSVGPENVPHYNIIVGSLQVQYSLIIALV